MRTIDLVRRLTFGRDKDGRHTRARLLSSFFKLLFVLLIDRIIIFILSFLLPFFSLFLIVHTTRTLPYTIYTSTIRRFW